MSRPVRISEFFRPLAQKPSRQNDRDCNNCSKFQVCLDVHQFSPDEIKVKTVGRNIIIEAKHSETEDEHGLIARSFVRKYSIPEGHKPNEVTSTLSSDGILTINAPRDPIILPDKNERIVPILQTGPIDHSLREMNVEHEKDPYHYKNDVAYGINKQDDVMLAIQLI